MTNNDKDTITKQDCIPEIAMVYLPMPLQNNTSTSEPWSTQDPAPRLSANPPCLTQ
jgi:hypothetical protein